MNRGGNKRGGGGRFNQWRNRKSGGPDDNQLDADGDVRIVGNNVEIKRRVTFKPQNEHKMGGVGGMRRGGGGGPRQRGRGFIGNRNIARALDDIEQMVDGENSSVEFRRFRNGRPGSPPPRLARRVQQGASGWFQIMIPHGNKYEKSFIMQSLQEVAQPDAFIMFYYKVEQNQASFWVDDFKIAQRLQDANRKIQTPTGHKMIVICRAGTPPVNVDEALKERMKNAMAKRYSPAYKALDLSHFHADELLLDVFCALSRPTIMNAALEVIVKNIPDLEALNLSKNNIHLLDHFRGVAGKLPRLKILYLSNNRMSHVSSMDAFKGVQLEELDLSENPAKDKYKDHSMYVRDVQKRFPKLVKLDGVELPKQIGFDIDEPKSLLPARPSFLINTAGADIVRQFLEQYYVLYDSNDRQQLLSAYHENAQFSLSVGYASHHSNAQRLTPYLPYNRNITRTRDAEQRCQKLKYGRLPIVSLLSELPATQHDPQSFGVDLTLFTEKLIHLTVTGMFKERKQGGSAELVRSFQKSLVIVPCGSGFCIRNEVMHINVATAVQEKNIFIPRTPQAVIDQPTFVAPAAGAALNDETKQSMVMAMCTQSGMNLEWSRRCLEETAWDYDRAFFIFSELHKENKIPPVAFVKQ